MKKISFISIFLCFLAIFVSACGKTEISSAKIFRDDARTGGSISFVYDQKARQISVGGKDEVIQFSTADEFEGNRIGLKVVAPDEKLNLEEATLQMNGVKYTCGDFLEVVDGQKQRYFNIYPILSKKTKESSFVVCWQEGTKEQEYKIVVLDGTKFQNKDGEIE